MNKSEPASAMKRLGGKFLYSFLFLTSAFFQFSLSVSAEESRLEGIWVPVRNMGNAEISYLTTARFEDTQQIDSVPHVRVSGSIHTERVAALRDWLIRDAMISKQFADPVAPSDGPHWYLQFSAAGYALEGHAAVLIFKIEEEQVTDIVGFGFWVESPILGASASIGPREFIEPIAPLWKNQRADGTVTTPDIGEYQSYLVADPYGLDSYRDGLERHWGRLPENLAEVILTSDRALKKTTRIHGNAAMALTLQLDEEFSETVNLNSMSLEQDFSRSSSVGVEAFREIWLPALSAACQQVESINCTTVSVDQSVYPQSWIEWAVDLGPHVQQTDDTAPCNAGDQTAELRLVSATESDKSTETGTSGVFVVDFQPGRKIFLDVKSEFALRYVGPLKNGRAEGHGTLYLGHANTQINWEQPHLRYITGFFSNGRLDGAATFFYANGNVQFRGIFSEGERNGPVDVFSENGVPLFHGTFTNGEIEDGPIIRTELNAWTLKPWRIFEGKVTNAVESGEWSFIPVIEEIRGGDRLVLIGYEGHYLYSNGDILTGAWDYQWGTFIGECSLQLPSGRLEASCDGRQNSSFPFDGRARFVPREGEVAQDVQDVEVVGGQFDHYRVEMVQVKEAGALRRLGREVTRWGKDLGEAFKSFICDFGETLADNCNVNIGVHVSSDGDVTIGSFPGDRPANQGSGIISKEALLWYSLGEAPLLVDDSLFVPLEFDSSPYFDVPKLSSAMPEELGTPAFPAGHVQPPTFLGVLRPPIRGYPEFGARRNRKGGGHVYHTGIDYLTTPGETVVSPITGIVDGIIKKPDGLHTIIVRSDEVVVKILYVRDPLPRGTPVTQGLGIATAANTSVREGYRGVPNHVHMLILEPRTKWAYNIDGTRRIFQGWPYPVALSLANVLRPGQPRE